MFTWPLFLNATYYSIILNLSVASSSLPSLQACNKYTYTYSLLNCFPGNKNSGVYSPQEMSLLNLIKCCKIALQKVFTNLCSLLVQLIFGIYSIFCFFVDSMDIVIFHYFNLYFFSYYMFKHLFLYFLAIQNFFVHFPIEFQIQVLNFLFHF